ncbi:MAG TPA: FG-GAP-like repeat-containing protein [Ohtaekwangia sp.]
MKRLIILILLTSSLNGLAQKFTEAWSVKLASKFQSAKAEWADLDNDGLLDILLLLEDDQHHFYISVYKGDTTQSATPQEILHFPLQGSDKFFVVDYNADNAMDLINPGLDESDPVTVYLNEGDFAFTETVISIPSFSKMLYEDFNQDGQPDWVISTHASGNPKLIFFIRNAAGSWEEVKTFTLNTEALEVVDVDGNGFRDLFVSGQVTPDSLFTGFLVNRGAFEFDSAHRITSRGVASKGDLNADGFFDLIFSGVDDQSTSVMKIYQSHGNAYHVKDTVIDMIPSSCFIADLSSDGRADISYWTTTSADDSIRLITTGENEFDTLVMKSVIADRFGDVEHDGDLDVLQIHTTDSLHITLFINSAPENMSPGAPKLPFSFLIFDHAFITWQRPQDDHTPTAALTYDVYLDGLRGSEFDLGNSKRLSVSHGNTGSSNFVLIEPATPVTNFAIEAVDNSFHAGGSSASICWGAIQACSVTNVDSIRLCSKEQIVFTSPSSSAWYSFSSGLLFDGTSLTYQAGTQSDVVFYFNPADPVCAHVKAWYIDVKDTTRFEYDTLYACKDEIVHLSVGDFWNTVRWENAQGQLLGTGSTLDHTVIAEEEIHAITSLGTGCDVDHEFTIRISKPDVNIATENAFVFYGNSVQLIASGAETYVWNAANGIFDTQIPDPQVSPTESTTYVVTGYDSIGCTDQAEIRITVERNGYIPSLFTPNDDAKNDLLRIYGMSDAMEFTFTIVNRNGSLVFSASNLNEADWDGTTRGVKQPNGVYFWKVTGKLFSGEPVQLNGKDSGSVVLVR